MPVPMIAIFISGYYEAAERAVESGKILEAWT